MTVRENLIAYGVKIARAGLVAGAGGNISARDNGTIWIKPSGDQNSTSSIKVGWTRQT